jgi:alanine racemase
MRRPAWVEIDSQALNHNFLEMKRLASNSQIMCCIKADAYGHGLVKAAWEFVKSGCDYLAVATLLEVVELRVAGIRTPIVLLTAAPRENVKDIIDLDVITVLSNIEDAELLNDEVLKSGAKPSQVLIAVETGMGRLGFTHTMGSIAEIKEISMMEGIDIKGIFSHFAAADEEDDSYTLKQIENFNLYARELEKVNIAYGGKTLCNSAGVMRYPEAHYDIVRPGISLYGEYPSTVFNRSFAELKPVMTVKAHIVHIKEVPAGFSVSYGMRFKTERKSIIGTVPVGYGDGLPRTLTGMGRVIINGVYAPIIGTICMDMCMVDLTDVPDAKLYDEVTFLGSSHGLTITADEIAQKTGTINYEILTRFGQRLSRIYKG